MFGKIFGDNSVPFSKVMCLQESRLSLIFNKLPK